MHKFTPGKNRILKSLGEKSKTFKTLQEDIGMNKTFLGRYLKELWEDELIGRNIRTREYFVKAPSYASLLFNDIIDFLNDYLNKSVADYEKSMLSDERLSNYFWFFLIENSVEANLREKFSKDVKKNWKLLLQLIEIGDVIENVYKSFTLSEYKPKERKIIEKYDQTLINFMNVLYSPIFREFKKSHLAEELIFAKMELEEQFPDVDIPEKMIQIKAERKVKDFERNLNLIYHPYNLEGLEEKVNRLYMIGQLRADFSEQEKNKLLKMLTFLEKQKNRRLYNGYKKRLSNRPKTLLMYPSHGFGDPLEKLKKFPESMRMKFEQQLAEGLEASLNRMDKKSEDRRKNFLRNVARDEGLSVAELEKQIEEAGKQLEGLSIFEVWKLWNKKLLKSDIKE